MIVVFIGSMKNLNLFPRLYFPKEDNVWELHFHPFTKIMESSTNVNGDGLHPRDFTY